MDSAARKTIEAAALGRPFGLGMLYDCRQDSLVPGLTLWDCKDLEKDQRERPQPNSDFQIVASESIDDKSSALNVDASLKASFLGGMVEVGGSAKYLNDQKASKNEARVTLKYKTTTKFQELSMSHLGRGNVKHPDVFEAGLATHVVTGILYGAQAFFVFGCEKSEKESRQDIQGNLQVMIKKIPCLSIEGKGKLSMKDEDAEKVEKFSCKFHGDFLLEKTPTTFQDAVEVYQSLPRLLGANGENAVPVQVWLLPLTNLDSKAAKLVRQISVRLVQQAQRVLEDFSELEMRCNDVLNTPAAQQFPQIVKKIKRFKEMCAEFKLEFQRILATKLPSIRGGGEEEAVLAEVLKKKLSSPFNSNSLSEWMDCKEREMYTMMSFTNKMKNTKILPSQSDLHKEVLSVEHALCFVFTSVGSDEPYLSALSEYLKGTQPADPQDPNTPDVEKEQWYASKEVMDGMIHKVKLFSDFAEANKENKNVKFLTAGLTDKTHKGSTIYLYKDGSSVSENFEPPSKPESVTAADIKHHSVTLKISPPRYGAESITSYSVEFCVRGEDGWRQEEGTKAGEATVSDLRPNTEYVFRCRAVTSAGVGPAFVSDPIRTSPCSPPGNLHAESSLCEISVSWEKPAEVGQDVQIVYYTVKYAATEEGVSEEDLQWKQIKSETQTVIVSMLQSDTEYAVRVVCDCGEAGRSKESVSVVCRTPDTYLLLLNEILHDFPDLETKGNKALRSTTVRQFPQIGEKLETFKSLCMKFKPVLLQKLREKVSLVLSRAEKEYAIMSMLEMRNTSSFSETNLRMWMDAKEKEIQVVQSTANEMKNTEIIPSKDVFEEKMNSTKYVLSFVFTSLGDAEVYLSALADFTNQSDVERPPGPQTDLTKWEPWFKEKGGEMSQKATLFSDFAEANKENKNVKFLTAGLTDKTHKGSTIYLYKDGSSVSEDFEPPSKPESVTAADIKHHSVTLKISPPRYGAESITSYSVEFCVRGEDGWRQEEGTKAGEATVSDLRPNTEYVFRCRAVTSAGVGPAFVSDPIRTSGKRLSDAVRKKSKKLEPQTGSPPAHLLPLTEIKIYINNTKGCRCFSYGKESRKPNRTIMVLGATGAGKSTLINGMINHILGVEWEDSYRFVLVNEDQSKSQAHSQTSEVTVYKINHQEGFRIETSLTIVDTPGFGDTRGIERDAEITEQLRNLFSTELGVTEIDAVCVVAQASSARFTPRQKYVFDSVLSIFGKDVAENIRILVTFADGQQPPVLQAIRESGVPCPEGKDGLPAHFKFNNSALFAENRSAAAGSMSEDDSDGNESFDQMFWNMGTKSMKRFFAALNLMETKSLTLTNEVLRERKQLEVSVESLQEQVRLGLAKLEEIKETDEKLRNKKFEFSFEVSVMKPFQQDISATGNYATNCQICGCTCHFPCGIPNDADLRRCPAMDTNGNCTACPGKCNWDVHFNQKYRWEYKEVKEKRTIKDLEKKYKTARGEKMTVQQLMEKLKAEYDDLQLKVMNLVKESAECLNRLKEIALRPNPLSTPDYIDMMIEGEKSEAKPGWKKVVQSLMEMKEKAEFMMKVEKGENPLWRS